MSNAVQCIKDELKALSTNKERMVVLRILKRRGLMYNNGTAENPIWLFVPGACLKHPRGCSAPNPDIN